MKNNLQQSGAFLGAKSSTVRGYNKVVDNIIKGFRYADGTGAEGEPVPNVKLTRENVKTFLKAYDKAKESNPILSKHEYRYVVASKVNDMMRGKNYSPDSIDDVAVKVVEDMNKYIEKIGGNDVGNTSRFFDIGKNI